MVSGAGLGSAASLAWAGWAACKVQHVPALNTDDKLEGA